MIYIASDHGGYTLKEQIAEHLKKINEEFTDVGPAKLIEGDDYPDYIIPAVQKILADDNSRGIFICRNGVGVSMLANRYYGVRAGLSWDAAHAESSRNDDDTNVLVLPADYIKTDEAIKVVDTWLSTPFGNKERYQRRLDKFPDFSL